MIVGIGIDVVSIPRFEALMQRQPAALARLFNERETLLADGSPRPTSSLAARFAAKEAVAKALGAPAGLVWHDCEIVVDDAGRPSVQARGSVAAAAAAAGIERWHLSLTHDADVAIAQVVAEGRDS